jgi:hypothetical protein
MFTHVIGKTVGGMTLSEAGNSEANTALSTPCPTVSLLTLVSCLRFPSHPNSLYLLSMGSGCTKPMSRIATPEERQPLLQYIHLPGKGFHWPSMPTHSLLQPIIEHRAGSQFPARKVKYLGTETGIPTRNISS